MQEYVNIRIRSFPVNDNVWGPGVGLIIPTWLSQRQCAERRPWRPGAGRGSVRGTVRRSRGQSEATIRAPLLDPVPGTPRNHSGSDPNAVCAPAFV